MPCTQNHFSFINDDEIKNSLYKVSAGDFDCAVSLVNVGGNHPFRMKRLLPSGEVINLIDQGFEDMRSRQKLPPVYIRSGNFYISTINIIKQTNQILSGRIFGQVHHDNNLSINIDHPHDLILAESLANHYSISFSN